MKTHDLIQGSPEWLAYRATHFNASDAPAMMGCSTYKTRTELLHEQHTGLTPEVDAKTQRRFDDGHRFEAMARPLAEDIIGEELYPVTGSEGRLSASFDGLTMMEDVAFEHKTLNDELRRVLQTEDNANLLPLQYRVQMEQQLAVSGAEKVLFMASGWKGDELVEERHCWYYPDLELRAAIINGWNQFEADLATYVPSTTKELPMAEVVAGLPALFIHAKGEITTSNMAEYGDALALQLQSVRAIVLVTDQDFSNAKASAKHLRASIDQAKAAKESMLASTLTVGQAAKMIDTWCEDMRITALQLEKDVEKEDLLKKTAMVQKARSDFADHVAALDTRLGKTYLPTIATDFAGVIKGKRSYTSMQDAIDTELANLKIASNAVADKIQINLSTLRELAKDHDFLFTDTAHIVLKAPEDLTALVKTRMSEFKASEAKRLEDEREKIRAEEVAKLAKEAADAETARIAKVAADKAEADRLEAQAIADAAPVAPMVEVKPEPITNTTIATEPPLSPALWDTQSAQTGGVFGGRVITPVKPIQATTTRAEIIAILDTLNERDMTRTLHFMQYTFAKQAA